MATPASRGDSRNDGNMTDPSEPTQQPTDETEPEPSANDSASSPEIKCVICFEPVENKSIPDCCSHIFCFSCLVQWAKLSDVCPLCMKSFEMIFYNFRSEEDYDCYIVTYWIVLRRIGQCTPPSTTVANWVTKFGQFDKCRPLDRHTTSDSCWSYENGLGGVGFGIITSVSGSGLDHFLQRSNSQVQARNLQKESKVWK